MTQKKRTGCRRVTLDCVSPIWKNTPPIRPAMTMLCAAHEDKSSVLPAMEQR